MSREVAILEHAEQLAHIVDEYVLKGVVNPTRIAKDSGLTRVQVVRLLEEWKDISANNEQIKQRAAQALVEFDRTYDQIINEYWNIYNSADSPRDQNSVMKNLADAVKTRQEVLQRAGLYDDAALGDQLVVLEQQIEEIKNLMREVSKQYPETKLFIMEQLGRIFKNVERADV